MLVLAAGSVFTLPAMTREEAQKAAAKGNTAAMLELARMAYDSYDFEQAVDALDTYRTKMRGKEMAADVETLLERAELGASMLDRVEKVQIIDSIEADLDGFYDYFSLTLPCGTLTDGDIVTRVLSPQWVVDHGKPEVDAPVFVTEDGDVMLWTAKGNNESTNNSIWMLERLADGTWDGPTEILNSGKVFDDAEGGEVFAPFLMSDGVTLYFAAKGSGSLGGYDVFITRRDEDGTFLQPQNIGMPYNSPANDYLFAIDELAGIGWWATDRNSTPGKVTIYRFVPSDLRVNYSPDTPGLAGLASLSAGVTATQEPGADYKAILDNLDRLHTTDDAIYAPDFRFALPGGVVYTSLDDFRNPGARRLMQTYLDSVDKASIDRQELEDLRRSYHRGNLAVKQEILNREKALLETDARLQSMANEVVKAEVGTRAY
ncbi:MAG: hypothetical protein J1E63_03285 [Muribaculaceae bacterium]|nr:hypothetical protein [Muribaculaceae bacterium]